MRTLLPASGCQYRGPQRWRTGIVEAEPAKVQLTLADTTQPFDAGDGDCRGIEPFETAPGSQPRLHASRHND
jgi:hypothetical protein